MKSKIKPKFISNYLPRYHPEPENDVWVGEGVAIITGVAIGENSSIATNRVVTKDFSGNTVFEGLPAKSIKYF